jgi:hypothetical protein
MTLSHHYDIIYTMKCITSDCVRLKKYSNGLCVVCYKKHWRHKNHKTNPELQYTDNLDQFAERVSELAASGLNISRISAETKLYRKQIIAIAKKNNIILPRHIQPNRQSKEAIFLGKITAGESIKSASRGLFNPKTAREVAYKHGFRTITPEEHSASQRLSEEALYARLGNKFTFEGFEGNEYKIKCTKCQSYFIRQAFYLSGECKICIEGKLCKTEHVIRDVISSHGLAASKLQIGKKEIDIFIKDKMIGIEYCGLRWHSDLLSDDARLKHLSKLQLANDNGIRLITIFEDEWLTRKPQVLNFLKSVLGTSDRKVFARKCSVRAISRIESAKFIDDNHIQGASKRSHVFFGLFLGEELLGVISGSSHHRGGSDLVLDRLCFKDGVSVAGGSSKLLKHFMVWACENGYRKIVSWSDNRWSEGNVYEKLGFRLEAVLPPDYSYVKGNKRTSKQSMKKANIAKKHPEIYSPDKTERQMTQELGLARIWDCGKKRWSIAL